MSRYFIVVGVYSICFTVMGLAFRNRGLEKNDFEEVIYGQKCLLTIPLVLLLGGVVGVLSSLGAQERLVRTTGFILSVLWTGGSLVLLIAGIRGLITQKKSRLEKGQHMREQAD